MLITKTVMVKWEGKTKSSYESKGYVFTKFFDEFEVKVEDLTKGNSANVDVLCDYCLEEGVETHCNKEWKDYLRSRKVIEKDCCNNNECQSKKVKETWMKKYNVENIFDVPEAKKKAKETMIEHYGVEYIFQLPSFMEQFKETIKERYGVESPLQSPEILGKVQDTNMIRYGFKSPMQNEEVKLKQRNTAYKNGAIKSSRQQRYLNTIYDGKINYVIDKISVDIAFPEEKIYIEYDGSGHKMPVKMKQVSEKDFKEREKRRSYFLIKLGWREIRIISEKDLLPSDEILLEILKYSKLLFNEDNFHRVIFDIDNNIVSTSQWVKEYNFGELMSTRNINI